MAMPDTPELNLDKILSREKLPKLSELDPDFYEKAAKLIRELDDEKNRTEQGSTKYVFLKDRLETTKETVRDIIHARRRKIVREANSQSVKKDKTQQPLPLTAEESKLYNALIDLIAAWDRESLDQVFGERKEAGGQNEKKKEKEKEPEKQVAVQNHKDKPKFKEYALVRMLKDVPTFVGMDTRNYTLAKEDVAMVPAVNAQALITRKAAVEITLR